MRLTRRCDPTLLALGRVAGYAAFGGFAIELGLDSARWSGAPLGRLMVGGALMIGYGIWGLVNFLFSSISLDPETNQVSLRRSPLLFTQRDWAGDRAAIDAIAIVRRPRGWLKPLRLELQLADGTLLPLGTFSSTLGVEDHAYDLSKFLGVGVTAPDPGPAKT